MEDESAVGEAHALVRDLRQRCAWDRAQTPQSLRPYLREEVAELEEALVEGDEARIASELGDLLLHFLFQVDLAEERGAFTLDDVARTLIAKMKRRHPHLYGGAEAAPWERQKVAERKAHDRVLGRAPTVLGHLPPTLTEIEKAYRYQERAAAVGFDWDDLEGPLDKLDEEVHEARRHPVEEIGDVLFAAVNVARKAGVHPTAALEVATNKFVMRFREVEKLAAERGIAVETAGLETLDGLWDEVKASGV
ncbi:MAG: nucleoside triphosphate pyrophosphohydrolase [Gemmatimonadota bacterium]